MVEMTMDVQSWLRKQLEDLKIPSTPVLSENMAVLHPATHVRLRGDFTKKGDEVAAAVGAIVAELGAAGPGDMGRVMAAAKAQLAGKADMAQVSTAVKQALAR